MHNDTRQDKMKRQRTGTKTKTLKITVILSVDYGKYRICSCDPFLKLGTWAISDHGLHRS